MQKDLLFTDAQARSEKADLWQLFCILFSFPPLSCYTDFITLLISRPFCKQTCTYENQTLSRYVDIRNIFLLRSSKSHILQTWHHINRKIDNLFLCLQVIFVNNISDMCLLLIFSAEFAE